MLGPHIRLTEWVKGEEVTEEGAPARELHLILDGRARGTSLTLPNTCDKPRQLVPGFRNPSSNSSPNLSLE